MPADIELAYPKILDIGPKLIQFCMLRRISTFPSYKYVPVVSVVLLSISSLLLFAYLHKHHLTSCYEARQKDMRRRPLKRYPRM